MVWNDVADIQEIVCPDEWKPECKGEIRIYEKRHCKATVTDSEITKKGVL